MMPQFIGAFLLASAAIIGGSLLWPKFMKTDRPAVLQAVHDRVVETDVGKKAEDVLGDVDISENASQTVVSVSSQVASQVGNTIQTKTEEIVIERIIEEVVRRYETLPGEQKEEIKTLICKPEE